MEDPPSMAAGAAAMTERILHFEDLQRIYAPDGPRPQVASVVRWADRTGIRYQYDRRGRIWTTLDAINASLGLVTAANQEQHQDEDLI
ncbi:hypothetical protein BRM22_17745 [Xanthomonas oryzae pv. oryzae]|nr:hypothetical protein AZ54_21905 [Xanthomonas oryzae pv. oryzae PXO86]AVT97977.1 hypothetical protein C0L89_02580 [Xanthomonas oryzae pv. oryzae]AXI16369.1 hypothetical protein CDO19_03130 [Xanthomonas oryzae pv. oryzae]AXI20330.1 hypothetical protein CDO11_03130 [Xanthomonas oryzae pv. oryzae]AXM16074.1 hypothetical protein BRN66_03085 [Xanthomonas oryzae pv. oryzae]